MRTMRVLRMSFLSGFVLELAASLSVALVAVAIGLRLLDGQLDLSVGLFVLLLAPEAFLPLRNVGASFHAATEGIQAAAERVRDPGGGGAARRRRRPTKPCQAGSSSERVWSSTDVTVRHGARAQSRLLSGGRDPES